MNKINVSLEVPAEWNEIRKQHQVTWRDIFKLGIDSLNKEPPPKEPAAHLKAAVESIMHAYNIIKKETPNT
jgi:hypothetical protein